jgi:ubiquinone/menaquinone biosynthesis C-methylase UbiE
MSDSRPVELEFSRKYDLQHAEHYLKKHQDGWSRRLSNWRDQQLARRALKQAGEPRLVLDLPCGASRFWATLAEHPGREILAADYSADMLDVARRYQGSESQGRVRTLQTSAFSIDLDDASVDCVFCMRLLHHVADVENRTTILREFHRVSRDTVILSLWVDGNYKAWRRRRLEQRREQGRNYDRNYSRSHGRNRFIIAREQVEREFHDAGFAIVGHQDFLPGYAMWRVYTLRKSDIGGRGRR